MDNSLRKRVVSRARRKKRVSRQIQGKESRIRLLVHKSNKHISCQLIDDEKKLVLGGVSTLSKSNRSTEFQNKSKASAKQIGTQIGQIAKEKNITKVVLDRGQWKYHGLIAELATAARETGLEF